MTDERRPSDERRPFLDYYREHDIVPVSQGARYNQRAIDTFLKSNSSNPIPKSDVTWPLENNNLFKVLSPDKLIKTSSLKGSLKGKG